MGLAGAKHLNSKSFHQLRECTESASCALCILHDRLTQAAMLNITLLS